MIWRWHTLAIFLPLPCCDVTCSSACPARPGIRNFMLSAANSNNEITHG
jgi:hypothetical protein